MRHARVAIAEAAGPMDRALLDRREQVQANAMPERRKREFVISRALLRAQLVALSGVPAEAWRLDRAETGQPIVSGPHALHASIAHTREWVAVAVAKQRIGIDIERRTPSRTIGTTPFIPVRERQQLAMLDAVTRGRRFLELWTLREAIGKALGCGLDYAPEAIELDVTPSAVVVRSAMLIELARWDLRVWWAGDHVVALAVELA